MALQARQARPTTAARWRSVAASEGVRRSGVARRSDRRARSLARRRSEFASSWFSSVRSHRAGPTSGVHRAATPWVAVGTRLPAGRERRTARKCRPDRRAGVLRAVRYVGRLLAAEAEPVKRAPVG